MSSSEIKRGSPARLATVMLIAVTALWGMSFPWTRGWQLAAQESKVDELLSALTLIGLRMPLGLVLLIAWQPRLLLRPTRREHLGGCLLGTVFFAGFALQTWGLGFTTPALSAFFTCLCSAWVPLIALFVFREKVARLTLLGLAVALIGCAVLVDGWKLNTGDWLTVGASLLFAAQMLVLDRLGKAMNPAHLSVCFLGTTGGLALVAALLLAARGPGVLEWAGWTQTMLSRGEILRNLICLAVGPTVLGFHWMNTYQPRVSATRAGLIYLLEPVFTSVYSVWWGFEDLTTQILLGGGFILIGNLLVEAARMPVLLGRLPDNAGQAE